MLCDVLYRVKDGIIRRRNEDRDLGVTFDSRMTFSNHIRYMCLSASKEREIEGFVIGSCCDFTNIHEIKSFG